MRERYKWPFYGIILGLGTSLLSRFLMLKQSGVDITLNQLIGNPLSVWTRSLAPFVLGIVFFYIGISRDRLIDHQEKIKQENKKLQKSLMDQSLRLTSEINISMDKLQNYTDQLDTIVNNIDSAICFVDRDLRLESGYNDKFVEVFGDEDYTGNSIISNIFSVLDGSKKKAVNEFLELCFANSNASVSILNEANPIKEFEFIKVVEGSVIHTVLGTKINIIKGKNKEISKIMFIFKDITLEHSLKGELEKREKEYSKRYSIMVALFGNDKNVIRRFIDGLGEDIKILSQKIKELKQNEKNHNTISEILGTVHSIKGEAFALGFEKLSKIAGEFEVFFKNIKDEILGLESNLEIIGFYEKLNNEKREFDKTINALEDFLSDDEDEDVNTDISSSKLDITDSVAKHLEHENISFDLLRKELEVINKSSAKETGKKSVFTLNTSVKSIDSKKYKLLKELFLHMLRNSIAHGIELPLDRLEAGKDATGQIILDILKVDNNLIFEYTDDGTGFNIEKIRKRAIEHDIASEDEISKMSNMDIIKIVFNDGFSTSDTTDMVSGAGVGMSVVKKNIYKELKGKFTLTNRPGRGIKIRITIPV